MKLIQTNRERTDRQNPYPMWPFRITCQPDWILQVLVFFRNREMTAQSYHRSKSGEVNGFRIPLIITVFYINGDSIRCLSHFIGRVLFLAGVKA